MGIKLFKQIVNDALRRALAGTVAGAKLPPYRVTPHRAQLRPGLDRLSLNRLVDLLDQPARLTTR